MITGKCISCPGVAGEGAGVALKQTAPGCFNYQNRKKDGKRKDFTSNGNVHVYVHTAIQ